MAEPCFAITGDGSRHYVNPLDPQLRHKKSVTTIKKQGVPNSILEMWRGKEVALWALDNLELLTALQTLAGSERADD